jgi:hypothetical protein
MKLCGPLLTLERGIGALAGEEMTVRPEDTLRAAGISSKRQAEYQRRMSSLLAGRTRVTMPISCSEEESHDDDEDPQDRRHQNAPAA